MTTTLNAHYIVGSPQEPFFIGVAADGFPIYSKYDSSNTEITNAQLDECHGYDPGDGYRYIANDEFPYVIGCFRSALSTRAAGSSVTGSIPPFHVTGARPPRPSPLTARAGSIRPN